MVDTDYREDSEVVKSINAWRQSERKGMIDTVQDLIRMSHKYAKSQYTPSNQRTRWAKLAGQLIWYQDQIMKNFSLEAMHIQIQDLKKRVIESNERLDRQNKIRKYPLIRLRKVENPRSEDAEQKGYEGTEEAQDVEDAKETVSESAQVD